MENESKRKKRLTTEILTRLSALKTFQITREVRANHSSGARSISPPRKLPLALSLAPLEILIFQETVVARSCETSF